MPYLTPRALNGLKEYKYKPGNYTILDEWHQPHWNAIVELLPRWLAPNLITLTGVVCLLVAYVVTAIYVPGYANAAPGWVYVLNGLAIFLYLHLDCLDGKQARRTGSSSPLGQLFDHGCDALSLSLVLVNLVLCAQPGMGLAFMVCIVLGPAIPFMLAHWEEYQTGQMLYGNGIWGVTEANYAAVIVCWFTAAAGPDFWLLSCADILPIEPLRAVQTRHVMYGVLLFGTLQTGVPQLFRVLTHEAGSLPEKERGNKQLGVGAAMSQLAQILVLFATSVALMLQPSPNALHARMTTGTYALGYALQTSRLIVAHMTKEPYGAAIWPLALVGGQLAAGYFHFGDLTTVSVVVLALTLAGYLHYVYSIVDEICDALKIKCLRIKPSAS